MQVWTLGFIGLGQMGSRMARNLLKANYRLIGYDIRSEAVAECVQAGGEAGEDAADVVRRSDVVMTSLVAHVYKQVAQKALLPNTRSGHIFIDFSTVPAPDTRRFAQAFADKGAVALDVPVSGWITGAESGQLSMFVGGDKATADRCWPLFEVLGDPWRIIYGGAAGMGQVLKVVQQLKHRLLDAARLEVLAFGVRAGLDLQLVLRAFDVDPESDDGYAKLYRMIAAGDGDELGCLFGEWPYYLAEARERNFPLPMLESLYRFCEPGPRVNKDGQGRPGPSVWRELMSRDGPALP